MARISGVSRKTRQLRAGKAGSAKDVGDAFAALWGAIASGDLLDAELQVGAFLALPQMAGEMDAADSEEFAATVLVDAGLMNRGPEGAAFLRLLMSLATPFVRKAASAALAELTAEGIYPLDWVTGAGKAVPRKAWRTGDVYGDAEVIAVTYGYGGREHVLLAQVDRTWLPVAVRLGVSPEVAPIVDSLSRDLEPHERCEQISLAQAGRSLREPVARTGRDAGLPASSVLFLPIVRSRVRRLPEADADLVRYTAADRAAAVDNFMKSPQAADLEAGPARFWAEVLAGYTARTPGEAPVQIGPHMLARLIVDYVPETFALSPAHRQHLDPAVNAWIRWTAAQRNFDETATAKLGEHVPEALALFDPAYRQPEAEFKRGYVADVSATSTDAGKIADVRARRELAVPAGDAAGHKLDPADPADRERFAVAEFEGCAPGGHRVVDELWSGDPPQTWETAKRMLAQGQSRHDIIHALAS